MILKRPLLAASTTDDDLKKLRFPVLLSPKIDGIRGLISGGQLLSRSMKPIRNRYAQTLFGSRELEGLDGELVVGNPWDKNLMQQTSSGVMSEFGTPNVKYYVFDKWDHKGTFSERFARVEDLVGRVYSNGVQVVPHHLVSSYEELIHWEAFYLVKGYEGVMIRDPNGIYKQNRSTLREGILLKVKRFTDGEAEVLNYEPLYRNENAKVLDERGYSKRSTHQANQVADELLGSLTVRCKESGQVFDIGSGFTEAQRRAAWIDRESLPGRIVKFKHFAQTGVKDKPRTPIFLGFRDPLDT